MPAQNTATCILVGVELPDPNALWTATESLNELAELCQTAGLETVAKVVQKRQSPHHKYYVGEGKLEEIKTLIHDHCATVLVTDDELGPNQTKTLEKQLNIKIIDRTGIILDIFAKRARTHEAQLQVELAQLEYTLPRLTRMWTHLSRLGGGIGTRGPGEKQLEVDRRQIGKRITLLKNKLSKVRGSRETNRAKRQALPVLTGAIIGYTNAGKSTLINQLTKADVLAEDKLFATLDPTTRKLTLPTQEKILLTDTVGFIQKLPHQLVTSFRSTLEEARLAHFLVHVVDISHPKAHSMITTANAILDELDATDIPQLYVFNKVDNGPLKAKLDQFSREFTPNVHISALKKKNLDGFLEAVTRMIKQYQCQMTFHIPFSRMDVVNLLHEHGQIISEDYSESIVLKVNINRVLGEKIMGQLHGSSPAS